MVSLPENQIIKEELLPLVQERLAAGYKVRYLPFYGVSMLPLLRQGIDEVEIGPLPEKLKKYDLPVYRGLSGKYIMHRVVKVKEDHYICLGDNTYIYEHILPSQMLGVVTTIKRGDKLISTDSWAYRLYARIWVAIYLPRKVLHRTQEWLVRLIK